MWGKKLLISGVAILLWSAATSQGVGSASLDELMENTALPYYEHLHVITDRECYKQGDTIFLRGDLFSAISNEQIISSQFIYVDLQDSNNLVLDREKIALDTLSGTFCGYFPISKKLTNGTYTLNAYTYFMQNQGIEYFFRKRVDIDSTYSVKYRLFSDGELFDMEYVRRDAEIDVEIKISDYIRKIDSSNVAVTVYVTPNFEYATPVYIDYMPFNAFELVKMASADTVLDYYIEISEVLSGYIVNRRGKPVKNTQIRFIGDDNVAFICYSDSLGYVECPVKWKDGVKFDVYNFYHYNLHNVKFISDVKQFMYLLNELNSECNLEDIRASYIVNGAQSQNIQFVFNDSATRYWNPVVSITKNKPLRFSFQRLDNCETYTVVVSGVNDQGKSVSGVWTVEN